MTNYIRRIFLEQSHATMTSSSYGVQKPLIHVSSCPRFFPTINVSGFFLFTDLSISVLAMGVGPFHLGFYDIAFLLNGISYTSSNFHLCRTTDVWHKTDQVLKVQMCPKIDACVSKNKQFRCVQESETSKLNLHYLFPLWKLNPPAQELAPASPQVRVFLDIYWPINWANILSFYSPSLFYPTDMVSIYWEPALALHSTCYSVFPRCSRPGNNLYI